MDYSRAHRFIAQHKHHGDPDQLSEWRGRELASLAWLLARRVTRGAVVAARLHETGGRVYCERNVRILHASYVTAGRDLNLEEGAYVMGLARQGVVFGDRVTVGRHAMIAPTNPLGGEPGEGLRVGDNSNIGPHSYIGCSGFVSIGDRVLMGPRVTLIAENHLFDENGHTIKEQGIERAPITIEDDCWIGADSTLLAGVTIGHGSVVAAGSVVTRDVAPLSVVAGVPARLVRMRGECDSSATVDD